MPTLISVAVLALIAWFVCTALTGASLVIFRTGSMSPTIPQGSIAVSLPIPAADIAVGDVVTVQRAPGELPVSHRVVEVRTPADAASAKLPGAEPIPADARELVLQGDANATVDTRPYVVREARRIVFSAPGVGAALSVAQSPIGFGALLLGAGTLTTWAFWPRRADPAGRHGIDAGSRSGAGPGPGAAPDYGSAPRTEPRRGRIPSTTAARSPLSREPV